MSFKVEVKTCGDKVFVANLLRFETVDEAEEYRSKIAAAWTAVEEARVQPSLGPANYRMTSGKLERIHTGSGEQRDVARYLSSVH